MQELQFHVRSYKVKYFPFVRPDLGKGNSLNLNGKRRNRCILSRLPVVPGGLKGITELFQSQAVQRALLSLQSFPPSASGVQSHCGGWCDCLFFDCSLAGKERFGQKRCLIDELQKPAWTVLSFSVIPAPNFPSFFSHCYFFSVHWVISAMMRLLYFFLSL